MTPRASLAYARSLYASGFPRAVIARACGLTEEEVKHAATRRHWRRRTPRRLHAVLAGRQPVRVRCGSCFAVYGDEAGLTRRPCPRCDQSQFVLGVAA